MNSGGNPEIAIALDVVVSGDGNSVVASSIPPEEQAHVVYFKPSEIDITYQDENKSLRKKRLSGRIMNFIEYIPCNWRFFLPNKSMNPFGNLNISPEEVVAAAVIEVPDGQTHVSLPNSAVVFPETVESKGPYKTFFVVPFLCVVFLVMSFPAVDFSVN